MRMTNIEAFFSPGYPWLALLLGLFIGSFLNVVIYRLPIMLMRETADDEERNALPAVNLWWPPSHCPCCQHNVMPWDNIPVVSWLLLRGRCRHCHCTISGIYPLSEAVIGVVFCTLVYWLYPQYSLLQLAFMALFLCLLYTLAVIDIRTFLLPDCLVFLLLWAGLIASVRHLIPISPRDSVMGAVFIWGFTWLMAEGCRWITGREGFGKGDVKLFAACATWLGVENIAVLMLGSALLGLCLFLFRYFYIRRFAPQGELAKQGYIPFGPAIVVMSIYLMYTAVLNL